MADNLKAKVQYGDHGVSLLKQIFRWFVNQTLPDVSIHVEGQIIQAHKLILGASSTFFKSVFCTRDSKDFWFDDIQHRTMKALIEFMYTGVLTVDHELMAECLKLADSLMVRGLSKLYDDEKFADEPAMVSQNVFNVINSIGQVRFLRDHNNQMESIEQVNTVPTSTATKPTILRLPKSNSEKNRIISKKNSVVTAITDDHATKSAGNDTANKSISTTTVSNSQENEPKKLVEVIETKPAEEAMPTLTTRTLVQSAGRCKFTDRHDDESKLFEPNNIEHCPTPTEIPKDGEALLRLSELQEDFYRQTNYRRFYEVTHRRHNIPTLLQQHPMLMNPQFFSLQQENTVTTSTTTKATEVPMKKLTSEQSRTKRKKKAMVTGISDGKDTVNKLKSTTVDRKNQENELEKSTDVIETKPADEATPANITKELVNTVPTSTTTEAKDLPIKKSSSQKSRTKRKRNAVVTGISNDAATTTTLIDTANNSMSTMVNCKNEDDNFESPIKVIKTEPADETTPATSTKTLGRTPGRCKFSDWHVDESKLFDLDKNDPCPSPTKFLKMGKICYACPDCTKDFTFKSNYRRHYKATHQRNDMPIFKCPICESRFKRTDNRNSHIRKIHHADPIRVQAWDQAFFMCTMCKKTFYQDDDLQCHINTVHTAFKTEPR